MSFRLPGQRTTYKFLDETKTTFLVFFLLNECSGSQSATPEKTANIFQPQSLDSNHILATIRKGDSPAINPAATKYFHLLNLLLDRGYLPIVSHDPAPNMFKKEIGVVAT